jgi:GNAT superfamily N-acetyltransferase
MAARSIKERRAQPYVIRQVDADEYASDIDTLQVKTELPRNKYDSVHWWLTFFEDHPVAYCGIMPSNVLPNTVYLTRVGVLPEHRGNALQLRMMRVAERWARCQGFAAIISDTTWNPPSANNFIRADYRTFAPPYQWAFAHSIYWKKDLAK